MVLLEYMKSSPRHMIHLMWQITVVSSLLATICMLFVMWKDVSPSAAFSWHPILMCASFLVCMTQGMNQYWVRDQLLSLQDLEKSRKYHAMLQISAFLLAIGGWVAIFVAHSKGKGHTAKGDPLVKQIHTWFGYLVLLGVVMQSVIGMIKFKSLPRKFAKWHGSLYAGPLIWLCGCINIVLALCFWKSPSYGRGIKSFALLCVGLTTSATLFFKMYVLKTNSNSDGTNDLSNINTPLI